MDNKIIKVVDFINTSDLPNHMWLVAEHTGKPSIMLWDDEETRKFTEIVKPDATHYDTYIYYF